MKFGMTSVNAGRRSTAAEATALARIAEETGFDSLWAVEHVVVPAGYSSRYPYAEDGRMPGREELAIADPLIWLTWAAAVTTRIKLATGILILPQRNPVVLAKEVASLDLLSEGRVLLGVGVGWLREEFDALGVPFDERAARTDEYVEALRALWLQDEPTFAGRFASFERAKSYPKPFSDTVPIVVGGHTDAAAERAGRLGDGFFPWDPEPETLKRLIDVARASAERAGRDPDALEISVGILDPARIGPTVDLGVDRIIVPAFARGEDEIRAFCEAFASDVMAAYA